MQKSVCDQFVNKVCQNLEARFLDPTDQNILAALGCILDPSCYPENEQSLAEYGASEIDLLESHYAAILPEEANCTTEFDNFKRIVHTNFKYVAKSLEDLCNLVVTKHKDTYPGIASL